MSPLDGNTSGIVRDRLGRGTASYLGNDAIFCLPDSLSLYLSIYLSLPLWLITLSFPSLVYLVVVRLFYQHCQNVIFINAK